MRLLRLGNHIGGDVDAEKLALVPGLAQIGEEGAVAAADIGDRRRSVRRITLSDLVETSPMRAAVLPIDPARGCAMLP